MPRKLQQSRACTRCGSTTNEFYKCSKVSDGLSSWCKPCFAEHRRELFKSNPEVKAARYAQIAQWAKDNPEKVVAKTRRWQEANPDKCERQRSRRHMTSRRPGWANKFFIQEIYDLARRRTKATGVPWVVDHIIPLKNPLVSGLHVENNLRVVTRTENAAKGNRFNIL